MKSRDGLWLFITLFLALIISLFFTGSDGSFDINIYDTYWVVSTGHFYIWATIIIFSLSYLLKGFLSGFSGKGSNIILTISLGLAVIIHIPISLYLFRETGYFDESLRGTLGLAFWRRLFWFFIVFHILFLAVFCFSIFKTAQYWHKKK